MEIIAGEIGIMLVQVKIPASFRKYAGNERIFYLSSGTIGSILNKMIGTYPELEDKFFNVNGKLKQYIRFFLNGRVIDDIGILETSLSKGDKLTIIIAVIGG